MCRSVRESNLLDRKLTGPIGAISPERLRVARPTHRPARKLIV